MLAQLAASQVYFEDAKADYALHWGAFHLDQTLSSKCRRVYHKNEAAPPA